MTTERLLDAITPSTLPRTAPVLTAPNTSRGTIGSTTAPIAREDTSTSRVLLGHPYEATCPMEDIKAPVADIDKLTSNIYSPNDMERRTYRTTNAGIIAGKDLHAAILHEDNGVLMRSVVNTNALDISP